MISFDSQAGEGSSDYQRVVKALPRDTLLRAYQEIETRLAEVRVVLWPRGALRPGLSKRHRTMMFSEGFTQLCNQNEGNSHQWHGDDLNSFTSLTTTFRSGSYCAMV